MAGGDALFLPLISRSALFVLTPLPLRGELLLSKSINMAEPTILNFGSRPEIEALSKPRATEYACHAARFPRVASQLEGLEGT